MWSRLGREWCRPYIIRGKSHTNREALNKMDAQEAIFTHGEVGPSCGRRPEFKLDVVWEHTPGNRLLHIFTSVSTCIFIVSMELLCLLRMVCVTASCKGGSQAVVDGGD